jgi:hypothetical protein
MDRAEVRKEIDWLMGSIKRSFEQRKGVTILIAIVGFIIFVGGLCVFFWDNPNNYADAMDTETMLMFICFGFLSFVASILDLICGKMISPIEDHHKLLRILRTFDRIWWAVMILVLGAFLVYLLSINCYRGIYWLIIFSITFLIHPKYGNYDEDTYSAINEDIEQLKEFD